MSRPTDLTATTPSRYQKPVGPMTEEQARQHVVKLKEFYWHLASFLVTMPILLGINLFTDPSHLWFIYAFLGWGFGVMGHAAEVFGAPGLGSKWEERKMQELMGTQRDEGEASIERLRALVYEAVDEEEARHRQAQDVDTARLLRRIEHLEAIVTSRDWEIVEADYRAQTTPEAQRTPPEAPLTQTPSARAQRIDLDALPEDTGQVPDEARAAYLARRVH
ncbi:MAG: 2TM domain-containing protein [Bacteroidota bacterium]